MGERERKAIIYGGIAIALILIFNFVVYPMHLKLKDAKVQIEIKKEELKQIIALGERYLSLSKNTLGGERKVESLFSYLSALPQRLGIAEKLIYIKPLGGERYELKLEGLTNEELVKYLSELEKDGVAIIREADIKSGGNPRRASLSLVVSTLE